MNMLGIELDMGDRLIKDTVFSFRQLIHSLLGRQMDKPKITT